MRNVAFVGLSTAVYLSAFVRAQDLQVTPASHVTPQSLPAVTTGEPIQFSLKPTQVGDTLTQRIGMELNLRTVITQGGQVAHDSLSRMRRRQERVVEVLEIADGHPSKGKVTFRLSRLVAPDQEDPEEETTQIVEGRTYFVTRSGESLFITDESGAIPTRDEYKLVLTSVESFGKPNLLAKYLISQHLEVGTALQVPLKLAGEMLALDQLGNVEKFELRLDEVKDIEGRECAVFAATISAQGTPESPLQVATHGKVVIELATTRTLEANLTGPLSMSTVQQQTEYKAQGDVFLAIRSFYGSAR